MSEQAPTPAEQAFIDAGGSVSHRQDGTWSAYFAGRSATYVSSTKDKAIALAMRTLANRSKPKRKWIPNNRFVKMARN